MIETRYKYPEETRTYSFEFEDQDEIEAGESLSATVTVTKTQVAGDADTLTVGTPAVAGTKVNVEISGGALNDVYQLRCDVTTSSGAIISLVGLLAIRRVN